MLPTLYAFVLGVDTLKYSPNLDQVSSCLVRFLVIAYSYNFPFTWVNPVIISL